MPKRSFDEVIDRLMNTLKAMKSPLSTREIARRASVDWRTARKFLNLLNDFSRVGAITKLRQGSSVLWELKRKEFTTTPENLRKFTEWTEAILSFRDAFKEGEKIGLARE